VGSPDLVTKSAKGPTALPVNEFNGASVPSFTCGLLREADAWPGPRCAGEIIHRQPMAFQKSAAIAMRAAIEIFKWQSTNLITET
jgi:hypothetical protein